ncbi:hypothetical protein [Vibrio sp. 10N.247.311.51]
MTSQNGRLFEPSKTDSPMPIAMSAFMVLPLKSDNSVSHCLVGWKA